jgi:hypothetical protein
MNDWDKEQVGVRREYNWPSTRSSLHLRIKEWDQHPEFIHIIFIDDHKEQ